LPGPVCFDLFVMESGLTDTVGDGLGDDWTVKCIVTLLRGGAGDWEDDGLSDWQDS
jgi:hypothetical protein